MAAPHTAAPMPARVDDWRTLPLELWQRCLAHLADRLPAFRACRQLATAVLLMPPARFRLDADNLRASSARLVQALAAGGAQDSSTSPGMTLVLFSSTGDAGPQRALDQLKGTPLTCVTCLEFEVRALLCSWRLALHRLPHVPGFSRSLSGT